MPTEVHLWRQCRSPGLPWPAPPLYSSCSNASTYLWLSSTSLITLNCYFRLLSAAAVAWCVRSFVHNLWFRIVCIGFYSCSSSLSSRSSEAAQSPSLGQFLALCSKLRHSSSYLFVARSSSYLSSTCWWHGLSCFQARIFLSQRSRRSCPSLVSQWCAWWSSQEWFD